MILKIFGILICILFGCLSLRTFFYTKLGNISKRSFLKNNAIANIIYLLLTIGFFLAAFYLSIGLKWYIKYILYLLPLPSISYTIKSSYSSRISRFIKIFNRINIRKSNPIEVQENLKEATKAYLLLKNKPQIAAKIYNEMFGIIDIEPDSLKDTLRLLLRGEDTYEYKVYKMTSNMDLIIYPGVDHALEKYELNNKL